MMALLNKMDLEIDDFVKLQLFNGADRPKSSFARWLKSRSDGSSATIPASGSSNIQICPRRRSTSVYKTMRAWTYKIKFYSDGKMLEFDITD